MKKLVWPVSLLPWLCSLYLMSCWWTFGNSCWCCVQGRPVDTSHTLENMAATILSKIRHRRSFSARSTVYIHTLFETQWKLIKTHVWICHLNPNALRFFLASLSAQQPSFCASLCDSIKQRQKAGCANAFLYWFIPALIQDQCSAYDGIHYCN